MPLERAPNREVRAPNVRKREPPRLKLQSGGVGLNGIITGIFWCHWAGNGGDPIEGTCRRQ